MNDCIVDTHILNGIITQFDAKSPFKEFSNLDDLSIEACKILNEIVLLEGTGALIVASSFAFIEILNQFSIVSKNKYKIDKLTAFLSQPPEWFVVEDYDQATAEYFYQIPKYTKNNKPIELADAIHIATAYQRGTNSRIITSDGRMNNLAISDLTFIR